MVPNCMGSSENYSGSGPLERDMGTFPYSFANMVALLEWNSLHHSPKWLSILIDRSYGAFRSLGGFQVAKMPFKSSERPCTHAARRAWAGSEPAARVQNSTASATKRLPWIRRWMDPEKG